MVVYIYINYHAHAFSNFLIVFQPSRVECYNSPMLLDDVKALTLQALFLDDFLSEILVLKGGTALYLHESISRVSRDIDFSLFELPAEMSKEELKSRFEKALSSHFNEKGHRVFHFNFDERGEDDHGGYEIQFKFVPNSIYEELRGIKNGHFQMHTAFERETGLKSVKVQFSKTEYCEGYSEKDIEDGVLIKVYTPEMILVEKLRAICQQMDEYEFRRYKTGRARDFYDIHVLNEKYGLTEVFRRNSGLLVSLVDNIFGVKAVDFSLLQNLEKYREFHAADYASLCDTVFSKEDLSDFNHYFDYVGEVVSAISAVYYEASL